MSEGKDQLSSEPLSVGTIKHLEKDLELTRSVQGKESFVQVERMGKYTIVHGIFPFGDVAGFGFLTGRTLLIIALVAAIYFLAAYLGWNFLLKSRGARSEIENDDAEQAQFLDAWAKDQRLKKAHYAPNPRAELAEEISSLLIVENVLMHLKDFTMNRLWREHSTMAGRIYCVGKITTAIKSLKHLNRNRNIEEAVLLLQNMSKTVLEMGYSTEFKNDLILVSSLARKLKFKRMESYQKLEMEWHCSSCGGMDYKILDGQRQCQKCLV